MKHYVLPFLMLLSTVQFAPAATPVNIDNFVRAETDTYLKKVVAQGGFGKFNHLREPTPIDRQDVIRMNRDTLYSMAVFDLTTPVTIRKPDAENRFQSMQVINQDHYTIDVAYNPGEYKLTQNKVGTRYVAVLIRTFVDATSPADIENVNRLQDQIAVEQESSGKFEVPDWEPESLNRIRDALNVLASTMDSTKRTFGNRSEVDPIHHLIGTAYGWGGNPDEAATYLNVVPTKNDGQTAYSLTVKDVPVKGFWSITVYDKNGFMVENKQNSNSFNNVTARKNQDGTITINFGRGPDAVNNIPITPGWNYIVRLYRPQKEILEGTYEFPRPQPVD